MFAAILIWKIALRQALLLSAQRRGKAACLRPECLSTKHTCHSAEPTKGMLAATYAGTNLSLQCSHLCLAIVQQNLAV